MSPIGPEIPAHLLNRHNTDERDCDPDSNTNPPAGPRIPPELLTQGQQDDEEEEDYVPALPPDMIATRSAGPSNSDTPTSKYIGVSGPTLIPSSSRYSDDDDDDDDVGPKPLPPGMRHVKTDAVKEFMEKE